MCEREGKEYILAFKRKKPGQSIAKETLCDGRAEEEEKGALPQTTKPLFSTCFSFVFFSLLLLPLFHFLFRYCASGDLRRRRRRKGGKKRFRFSKSRRRSYNKTRGKKGRVNRFSFFRKMDLFLRRKKHWLKLFITSVLYFIQYFFLVSV